MPGGYSAPASLAARILMSLTHRFLKTTRTIHLYLGVFAAPMLLFFAITGGLQTFGLHESERGGSYSPPAWLATLAQLHKKQTTVVPVRRPRPGAASALAGNDAGGVRLPASSAGRAAGQRSAPVGNPAENADGRARKNLWPMKIFFAAIALSLMISVLTGLYMAWRFTRKPRLIGALVLAGIVVPLLLLLP